MCTICLVKATIPPQWHGCNLQISHTQRLTRHSKYWHSGVRRGGRGHTSSCNKFPAFAASFGFGVVAKVDGLTA